MNIVVVSGTSLRVGAAFACPVAVGQERGDGRCRGGGGDDWLVGLVGVEGELGEADRVEGLPLLVQQAFVEPAGVGQEVEEGCDDSGGLVQVWSVVGGELGVDGVALGADVADAGGEFLGGPVGVAEEFDDLALKRVEAGAFAFEVAAQRCGGRSV
ncbi:hypothetical protein [Glycomyces albidus]|uniref:Uncharacterized protein n=1 Tax=Glycomyces albidus TaxID=2656774 RepID=A0A6L5G6H1_9ACTN|nr:hypothetical protein [Glycomyces albidus]MQM25245.1 hypothetical protein [Glycomyces albidus]